ncbi:MAG: sulfotransferase, partial [Woeseiaceae bacterium]|nr:sulfotransferase [Woeseiaceae bacterium]
VRHCQKLGGEKANAPADLVGVSVGVNFEELGADYIAATRSRTGHTAHFVDKLPLNFLYAGSIHLALPKAKIVLLERDPMDTCYAVFKAVFESVYPFSYDLTELANYYVAYRQLIDHWQAVMPGVLHVVNYEELATEPKPVIENLLSYCGLSWEEACLKYYDNEQASTTASAVQVRDALYRTSIGKWRNYEKQLAPVAEILDAKLRRSG